MATLENIRKKGGVIVALVIGLALVAFVLTDLLNSGGSIFRGSQMELANINGTSVSILEYQEMVAEMEEFNKLNRGVGSFTEEETNMLRDQTWNQLVNQTLFKEKYELLGIEVTSDELMDMITGNNIHPYIIQHPLFMDQMTGMYSREQAINFLQNKNSNPTLAFYWRILEEQLINEKLYNKYSNLFKKGMYITNAWVESEVASQSKSVDFDFVMARYTTIPDSTVTIPEAEIKSYYQKNKEQFKQEASRDFEYVTFDIVPTEADKQLVYENVMKMKVDFSNPNIDAVQYAVLNSDEPYFELNQKANELGIQIEEFATTAQIGEVFGPYLENDAYKLARLVAINNIPDSVKARHILIQEMTLEASHQMADSLMALVRRGTDFAVLAIGNSMDQGSAINGGDLGWFTEGMMVKPFNDACFLGKKGDLVKVETQYGVHIIDIQDQTRPVRKYQVATVERKIIYSTKTYQDVYTKATNFRTQYSDASKFNEGVTAENLTKRFGRQVRKNDRNVGTLESPRELVRWAFESKAGTLSTVFEFGDQFVIALLTTVAEEGYSPMETVKPRIERELINNKKAELLITQFNTAIGEGKDLESIATAMNSTVQNAEDINFGSYSVPGAGAEPVLVSLAVNSPVNQLSKPAKGSNGVFIVKVTSEEVNEVEPEIIRSQLASNAGMSVDYRLIEALKKNVKIKDNRSNFY